ncbi:unnamed protein product [Rotaria magnacalcarata]|uniref:RING-type domain-containing protein n=1 Tax=Rotaria magnacalcarata TaxID=392030 RepID=A0A816A6J7_9BILA|nr:unnamed protein product [Rotaria magnacalcarata]CAF1592244.1 unnamed protein product [Rotaria magnacalcarata]
MAAADRMQRLATCPICLDKFRLPRVLPCMHTFCLTPCLTNLVDPRARSLRCPECRREHVIPQGLKEKIVYIVLIEILISGGVQAFPSNLTMIGFLDIQPSTNIDLPDRCCRCNAQKQTLVNCHDCSNFFCTECREPHLRETFQNINSSVSQLRRTLPALSDKITPYQQRVNIVKTNHEQIRREISLAIATLIDELKHREAALLTEAEVYMQSQLRTSRLQQENGEVELASIASFCESVGAAFANGQFVTDVDLANMRAQSNRYSQQIQAVQTQIPSDVQKLRLVFNDQAAVSSAIQNFGRLIDTSQEQQSLISVNQVAQFQQQQQPRVSTVLYPPYATTQYVTPPRNPSQWQAQSQNDQYRHLENLYYSRRNTESQTPLLSQTIGYLPTQIDPSRSANNPFADLSATVPARANTSSYTASWDPQGFHRSTSTVQSSSIFGSNPFAAANNRQAQQSSSQSAPPPPPESSPRRNYVTSTTAARSLEGDDRPIFGGRGSGNGGGGGRGGTIVGRGRGQTSTISPIQEQVPSTNGLQRQRTFILDQPSAPNLPQSGAQKPRDTVIVRDLYNVRRRNRARTPVAFTVDLNQREQTSTDNSTG